MASTSVPGIARRTVTIRVRALVLGFGMVVLFGGVWYALHWATSLTPLTNGAEDTAPIGLGVVPHTSDPADTGPPAYTWQRGGRFVDTLWLINSASVPITITGATHTPNDWVGQFTGPTLGIANTKYPGTYSTFHPVTIPAGGERAIAFIFHANPHACGNNTPGTTGSTDAVTLHFTTLSVFSDTQAVALDQPLVMRGPTKAACTA